MSVHGSSVLSDLTPKHVRAARALLAWSQQDLAKAAGVAISTIADFERGQRTPIANNALAIRAALEGSGIHFLPTGAVVGPPIPLLPSSERSDTLIRWVTGDELSAWADRIDGAASLPELLSRLIRATHGPGIELRFSSDGGIRHPGWDGFTSTETASPYVPSGKAGWEIGAQRTKIAQKASEDYGKRTAQPAQLNPASDAFVFVTPRHWPQKAEWAKARQKEGPWRDVRAYDVDDLVHWIEQRPAVGLWLAHRLSPPKRPPGTRELEELWDEWSLATRWPLTEDLVLSDRDEDAAEVMRWLRGKPSVLSLQATSTDEVVAFFHATLSELPSDVADAYRARCLVTTTADAARALANAPGPLILLLTDPEPGLARRVAERGHYVLQAYDDRPLAHGGVRVLARPSHEGIASALTAAGIAEPRAKALARDSARNLAVLRRLIPSAYGRSPKWAEEPPRALLAALLAGGWDENAERDRAQLSEIANQPYEAIIASLTPYLGELDSPLQKVGSGWRVASPFDAWLLLAHYLTSADIARFEAAAHAVLGSADPRFDMDADERWMAPVHGIRPEHSKMLRHGIGQVLILLALWGDRIRAAPDASRRADMIVRGLLRDADRRRWWSLSGELRLLAEASPNEFLSAIEENLDHENPSIAALFGHDGGGLFGTEYLSDLMWALESLAWSPDWMPRVTHVLARLDNIDTKPRGVVNGPANSLRAVHSLWNPQTHATLDQRLKALDLVRKHETRAAWKLMLKILPQGGGEYSMPSPSPRWRDFAADEVETVTWGVIERGAAAISERLLADVGLGPGRWSDLLDRLTDLVPGPERSLETLEAAEPRVTDMADRSTFWNKLRSVLHRHREFPDAEWSLPDALLHRLESIYDRFAPTEPLERIAWLFQHSVELPKPPSAGWEAEQTDIHAARQQAARALYDEGGLPAVLSLARLSESAGYIGQALHDSGLPAHEVDAVLESAVRSDDARERDLARGLIAAAFREGNESWAADLLANARAGNWDDDAVLTILLALPIKRWTWDQVAQIGGEIEKNYWRSVPIFWASDDGEDTAYAIRQLIGVGRAQQALPLAARRRNVHLPSDLLVEVLKTAATQAPRGKSATKDATMFQHYVAEILQLLDKRDDVETSELVALEWCYLRLLEHSQRPAKTLVRALSEQPSLFVLVLRAVFKPSEESGILEPEPEDTEQARALAEQAYRLLELWNRIPGTRDDGTIDGKTLEGWIKDARSLAKASGREGIADERIGTVLSASPLGADGNWPAEPVRVVLDLFRSQSMTEGFRIGKRNRRGVTRRGPRDGGELERSEAARYRTWAEAVTYDHPHTAKALRELAEAYEMDARRHDEDAKRRDWEP